MSFYVLLTFILGTNQCSSMTQGCLMVHQDAQVLLATPGSIKSIFFLPEMWIWFGFDSNGADYVYTPFSVKEAKAHTQAGPGSCAGGPTLSLRWSEQGSHVGVLRHMLSVLLHSRQVVQVQVGPQLSPGFGHCLRERFQMCGRNNITMT